MKTFLIRYLAGLLFLAIGVYEWINKHDLPESLLYIFLGLSFLIMGFQAHFPNHSSKSALNIASWIFILASALAFLYVLTIP